MKTIKLNGLEIRPNLKNIKSVLKKSGIKSHSKIEYICNSTEFVWSGSTKLWRVDGTNVRSEWTIQNNQINKNWVDVIAREILQYVKRDFSTIKLQRV